MRRGSFPIILEVITSQDLWINLAFFFGMLGSHNDLNVCALTISDIC
jgi:hypothetical protein